MKAAEIVILHETNRLFKTPRRAIQSMELMTNKSKWSLNDPNISKQAFDLIPSSDNEL